MNITEKRKKYLVPRCKFNPNEYELKDWMALGLSKKQSQAILNFVKYEIHSNQSLEKIYALPAEVYELIKDSTFYDKPNKATIDIEAPDSVIIRPKLEINSADLKDLIGLAGIGEFYAKQIVKYRMELGGFSFKEQILEVWKMRIESYEKILPQIYIDTSKIKKININECSIDDLKMHPYLDYYQANSIFKMRIQKGQFVDVVEILESKLIDEEELERLFPYLGL